MLTWVRAKITKILGYACQVFIILLCFGPLFLWSILETIFVESWRRCAPAKRNPNRAPSRGLMFAMRSNKRRRLSVFGDAVDDKVALHNAVSATQPKARGFFDMPYELRERIWLDVLCPAGGVHVTNHPRVRRVTWTMQDLEEGQIPSEYSLSNILKLNRSFYCEGIALLYTHNSFTFACPNVLTSFTRTVLPRRLELIKHLKLSVHCHTLLYNLGRYSSSFMESDWQIACASLQRFTGLKTLTINIRIESYHSQRSTRRGWDGFAGSRWLQRILSPLEPLSARDDFLVRYTWPERDCSQWPAGKFRMEHEPGYA